MSLKDYKLKRDFTHTPEPEGDTPASSPSSSLRFVIQAHAATVLHFDLRLELEGVLKSWAVPKMPTLNPAEQRLAIKVEDHPIEYGSFEGVIPKGQYGAGEVIVWDRGTYLPRNPDFDEAQMLAAIDEGHLTFLLSGERLQGEFALVKLKKNSSNQWLLLKKKDKYSSYKKSAFPLTSIVSGKGFEQIKVEGQANAASKKPTSNPLRWQRDPQDYLSNEQSKPFSFESLKPCLFKKLLKFAEAENWIYEGSYGGTRVFIAQNKVLSKSRRDITAEFPFLKTLLNQIPQGTLIDGEVDEEHLAFVAFDLPFFEGQNLQSKPLDQRKKALEGLKQLGLDFELVFEGELNQVMNSFPFVRARYKHSFYQNGGVHKDWFELVDQPNELDQAVLTSPSKVLIPDLSLTKEDIAQYYQSVSLFILPHLKNRPLSLLRFPHGIEGKSFFQKDYQGYLPSFVDTFLVHSSHSKKHIRYLVCNNQQTLQYLINLCCIDFHVWNSKTTDLEKPSYVVVDIDPNGCDFSLVVELAHCFVELFDRLKIRSYIKTSGSTGMHIYLPVKPKQTNEQLREFALKACRYVHKLFPQQTSLARSPKERVGKVYLDYLQNRKGATMASVYSVRPTNKAAVSMPVLASELTSKLTMEQFHIKNAAERLQQHGDLWADIESSAFDFERAREDLEGLGLDP